MANLFESGAKDFAGMLTANKNKKAAKANREQQMAFTGSLPWEPAYASQRTPTYQTTQSPVARKYLESILTGTNPDTTFSGAPNAAAVKQYQGQQGDAMYGNNAQLAQQGAAQRARTPWAVNSRPSEGAGPGASASAFGKPGTSAADASSPFSAQSAQDSLYPGLAAAGLNIDDVRKQSNFDVSDADVATLSKDPGFWDKWKSEKDDAHRAYDVGSTLGDGRLGEAVSGGKVHPKKKKIGHGRFWQILGA